MIKKISDIFKKLINTYGKKKLIENTVIVIIIGMIILIAGSSFFKAGSGKKDIPSKDVNTEVETFNKSSNEKESIEERVEAILSRMEDVGKVNVMITYVSGSEIVPALNTKSNESSTDEKDNGGGTRNIRQSDQETNIAYEEGQGVKKPIIIKEKEPEVKGVIVVAEGGNDVTVREKISKAVQVLLDVPIHKVQVFERKK